MISLLQSASTHPLTSFLVGIIQEADPTLPPHASEAIAQAATNYLEEIGFRDAIPTPFVGLVLAHCLGRIGRGKAAEAVLRETETIPLRRQWWMELAADSHFDPVLWHAMQNGILRPAGWFSSLPDRAVWLLDFARFHAEGIAWAELAWRPPLTRLLKGLCQREDAARGAFTLALCHLPSPAEMEHCAHILAHESRRRNWTHSPTLRRLRFFGTVHPRKNQR